MTAVVAGFVLIALSLLAWAGQTMSWFAPDTAARWGLTEREADVDRAFYADIRGEALWDVFSLWTLVVAGFLLVFDNSAWAYFGLVGGGMYVYFGGRGMLTRRELQARSLRIGSAPSVKTAYAFLALWMVAGLITIVASVRALGG